MKPQTTRSQAKPIGYRHILYLFAVIGFLATSMILYGFYLGVRVADVYTPLQDAAMETKLEATSAHLKFDEIMSGERHPKHGGLPSVHKHLDNADWYIQAMLKGGENSEGRFIPIEDEQIHSQLVDIQASLAEFRQLTRERWELSQQPKIDAAEAAALDQQLNNLFNFAIQETDSIETKIQQLSRTEMVYFNIIHLLLLVFSILMTVFISLIFYRFVRSQQNSFSMLEEVNQKLNQEIEKRKKVEAKLEMQASTDALTNAYNRSKMGELLDEEWSRAKRYGTLFSLVMLDIDHFKEINDEHGHQAGDKALIAVAQRLTRELRDIDCLARWGGEEFLLLLPNTSQKGATELAERCRVALMSTPIESFNITASFGTAQYDTQDQDLNHLLKRVDIALYQAKNAGRNRVVASDPSYTPATNTLDSYQI